MEFVAIDFETASGNANSACQLAAVTVKDCEIVTEHSWLIRPPRMYFSPRNIAIHGIRPSQVRDAKTMAGVWTELSEIIDGKTLVAHNARFDIGVLINSLAAYEIDCPNLDYSCTRAIARGAWPGRPRYGLKPLGDWLGINFDHHDALEDARCCAWIAIAASKAVEQDTLTNLEKALRISRGSYINGTLTGPRQLGRKRGGDGTGAGRTSTDRWGFPTGTTRRNTARVDPRTILDASADSLPLAGKIIRLLGPLRGLDKHQSEQLIERLGGICTDTISPETTFVVACGMSLSEAGLVVCNSLALDDTTQQTNSQRRSSPSSSSQTRNSQPNSSYASGVRILSERQFRALLPGGKASV